MFRRLTLEAQGRETDNSKLVTKILDQALPADIRIVLGDEKAPAPESWPSLIPGRFDAHRPGSECRSANRVRLGRVVDEGRARQPRVGRIRPGHRRRRARRRQQVPTCLHVKIDSEQKSVREGADGMPTWYAARHPASGGPMAIECRHCQGTGTCSNGENGNSCDSCVEKAKDGPYLFGKRKINSTKGLPCGACQGYGDIEGRTWQLQSSIGPFLGLLIIPIVLVIVGMIAATSPTHHAEILTLLGTLAGSIRVGFCFRGHHRRRRLRRRVLRDSRRRTLRRTVTSQLDPDRTPTPTCEPPPIGSSRTIPVASLVIVRVIPLEAGRAGPPMGERLPIGSSWPTRAGGVDRGSDGFGRPVTPGFRPGEWCGFRRGCAPTHRRPGSRDGSPGVSCCFLLFPVALLTIFHPCHIIPGVGTGGAGVQLNGMSSRQGLRGLV